MAIQALEPAERGSSFPSSFQIHCLWTSNNVCKYLHWMSMCKLSAVNILTPSKYLSGCAPKQEVHSTLWSRPFVSLEKVLMTLDISDLRTSVAICQQKSYPNYFQNMTGSCQGPLKCSLPSPIYSQMPKDLTNTRGAEDTSLDVK